MTTKQEILATLDAILDGVNPVGGAPFLARRTVHELWERYAPEAWQGEQCPHYASGERLPFPKGLAFADLCTVLTNVPKFLAIEQLACEAETRYEHLARLLYPYTSAHHPHTVSSTLSEEAQAKLDTYFPIAVRECRWQLHSNAPRTYLPSWWGESILRMLLTEQERPHTSNALFRATQGHAYVPVLDPTFLPDHTVFPGVKQAHRLVQQHGYKDFYDPLRTILSEHGVRMHRLRGRGTQYKSGSVGRYGRFGTRIVLAFPHEPNPRVMDLEATRAAQNHGRSP